MRPITVLLGALLALGAVPAATAQERVRLLLDWHINADHAPILVAERTGAFEDVGLDVEIVPPSDPNLPPRLAAARQAEIAISYQPQLYFLAQEGLPLRAIGALVDRPLNTLTVLEGSGVETLADLRGKTVGYAVGGIQEATLYSMLEGAGLAADDVTAINVNFQLVTSLLSEQVDAIIGGFRNIEGPELRSHGAAFRSFFPEEHGIPGYDELIFVAHPDFAESPHALAFLEAVNVGIERLRADPRATWQTVADAYRELDNELNWEMWLETAPYFASDVTALDEAKYERYQDFLLESDLIGERIAIDRLIAPVD